MNHRHYDFFAERSNFGRSIAINMATHLDGDRDFPTKRSVATSIVFTEVEPGKEMPINPLLTLTPTDAQALMDELWHCGLRPTHGSGSAGSLAATERHLDDMRKIAFELLQVGS